MDRIDRGVCVITGGGRGIGAATARLAARDGWTVCLSRAHQRESAEAVATEVAGRAVHAQVTDETSIVDIDGERMRAMIEVNTLGTMYTIREALRRMSRARGGVGGSVVAVSSMASRLGSPGQYVDYAASKGAVDSFVTGAAKEVAAEGVRVNAVLPGIIDTGIHADSGNPNRPAEVGPSLPMGRAGSAEEVAEAIVWLLGDRSSYVTGAHLDVAGAR